MTGDNKDDFFDEKRLKYMDYLQEVINRMSNNQLAVKGSACTALIPAFFGSFNTDNIQNVIIMSLILVGAIIVFTVLDGFYLKIEREYRNLYKRTINPNNKTPIDFNMGVKLEDQESLCKVIFSSKSVMFFYIALVYLICIPMVKGGVALVIIIYGILFMLFIGALYTTSKK